MHVELLYTSSSSSSSSLLSPFLSFFLSLFFSSFLLRWSYNFHFGARREKPISKGSSSSSSFRRVVVDGIISLACGAMENQRRQMIVQPIDPEAVAAAAASVADMMDRVARLPLGSERTNGSRARLRLRDSIHPAHNRGTHSSPCHPLLYPPINESDVAFACSSNSSSSTAHNRTRLIRLLLLHASMDCRVPKDATDTAEGLHP